MEDVAGRFPLQPQRLPCVEQSCPYDMIRMVTGNGKRAGSGIAEQVKVEFVSLSCRSPGGKARGEGAVPLALTVVDRVAMAADPFADLLHLVFLPGGDRSVRPGANVEQVIAVAANTGDQTQQHFPDRFPISVNRRVAPQVAQRIAQLPRAFAFALQGGINPVQRLFGRPKIAGHTAAVVHQNRGLQATRHAVEFSALPGFRHFRVGWLETPPSRQVRPGAVVPENVDLPVVGKQFADLLVCAGDHASPALRVMPRSQPVGLIAPIKQRVVNAHTQVGLAGGLHIGCNQIMSWCGRHRVKGCRSRVPQAVPFMMPGPHHHVLASGRLGNLHPFVRVILAGSETRQQSPRVLIRRYAHVVHHPAVKLAAGIEAPVDEHSEARLQPPAGPFLGGGQEGEHRKQVFVFRDLRSVGQRTPFMGDERVLQGYQKDPQWSPAMALLNVVDRSVVVG